MKILQYIVKAIREASVYNPDIQVQPSCILWPDHDRQWESIIGQLQTEMPELFVLGDYQPEKRTGPAIWLRCILSTKVEEASSHYSDSQKVEEAFSLFPISHSSPLIFYLPGVSRQHLRAVETCPDYLKPLAELQYQGTIWSQVNAKDWTILAFLKSDQGGLGLDVAQDSETKSAMRLALYRLIDEDIELLRGRHLDKDYFNTLLSGDPVRDLLQWLDKGDDYKNSRSENEWLAFIEVCKSQLGYDIIKDGALEGVKRLANQQGPWITVWERYAEAPKRYPNIPNEIRRCALPHFDSLTNCEAASGWPQWNDAQENDLRQELLALADLSASDACAKIFVLEKKHGCRRSLVWAEIGEAPLAQALAHLAAVAEVTLHSPVTGNVDDIIATYKTNGWRADSGVLSALSEVLVTEDFEAVATAIRAIYMPWAQDGALHLQKTVYENSYPGGTIEEAQRRNVEEGECVLFVDGLRFDCAMRLIEQLRTKPFSIEDRLTWAALPSVTSTGKPAVSPVRDKLTGCEVNTDFEPQVSETGQSVKGGYHFKKLLGEQNWTILERTDMGDGKGNAWYEFGNIDHEGHSAGWKLAKNIDSILNEIAERIDTLLETGWKTVRVVTDHGWLLLPGGLPKIQLPAALSENTWGRCAAVKEGAVVSDKLYNWYWNPVQQFALADGIGCYRAGLEYAHGGLSVQECLTLELTISKEEEVAITSDIIFTDIVWKGMRCTVVVDGDCAGVKADIRFEAGNPDSSVAVAKKPFKGNGTSSLVVEDEDLTGHRAWVIIEDANGKTVAQKETRIGGGELDND